MTSPLNLAGSFGDDVRAVARAAHEVIDAPDVEPFVAALGLIDVLSAVLEVMADEHPSRVAYILEHLWMNDAIMRCRTAPPLAGPDAPSWPAEYLPQSAENGSVRDGE